jgi:hypothetical protein
MTGKDGEAITIPTVFITNAQPRVGSFCRAMSSTTPHAQRRQHHHLGLGLSHQPRCRRPTDQGEGQDPALQQDGHRQPQFPAISVPLDIASVAVTAI